jgi:hypothetical protein
MIRSDMADDKLAEELHGHKARNASFLARIRELAVPLDVARLIECSFRAPDGESAEALRALLRRKGLLGVVCSPPPPGDTHWSVRGQLNICPDLMGSQRMTAQLVQLAATCGAEYDGWGTRISEAQQGLVDGTRGGPTRSIWTPPVKRRE